METTQMEVEESSCVTVQTHEEFIVPDDVRQAMLKADDLKKFHLKNKLWFWNQDAMLQTWKRNGSTGFLVARDKFRGKGEKMYGLFRSPESFFEELRSLHPHDRCFYELIPQGQPCRAYADLEWLGNPQEKHARIEMVAKTLRAKLKVLFPHDTAEIYVLCSSRATAPAGTAHATISEDDMNSLGSSTQADRDSPTYKHSYHVVVSNVIFPSNHDESMHKFFESLIDEEDDSWFYMDDKGIRKCILDISVYSKNRCFRLPFCNKLGSDTPLIRISGDPGEDRMQPEDDEFRDLATAGMDDVLPMIVSKPMLDGDSMIVTPEMIRSMHTSSGRKRTLSSALPSHHLEKPKKRLAQQSTDSDSNTSSGRTLPIPMCTLKDALASLGDNVSNPTKCEFLEDESAWKIQCDQKKQIRKCLLNPDETHSSNNCILFVRPQQRGTFALDYHCTSSSCKRDKRCVGVFSLGETAWNFVSDACFSEPSESEAGQSDSPEDDPENNTYELVKARFEERCMKVNDPFVYIRLHLQSDNHAILKPIQMKHSELLQYNVHLKYFTKDGRGKWQKRSFINEWVQDSHKREVHSLVVDPRGTKAGVYNLWVGYTAANLNHELFLTDKPDKYEFVMGPITDHLNLVVTGGNQVHTEWILDWIANIIQRPWKKTEVGLVLFGRQGCGKGILFDWLREHVLGKDHTGQISNPSRDLFSRFSDGFLNKTLVQVDEVKCLHDHADQLKDMITNSTVNWEPKNGRMSTVENLCNFLFTTNNENSFKITPDDRRFALFSCSSQFKGNSAYFDKLVRHLHTPGVSVWFYKLMMERDLSKYTYSFQPSRPITDSYKEAQKSSIKPLNLFVSALVNSNVLTGKKMSSAELYRVFKEWCLSESYKHVITSIAFGRDLNRIKGVGSSKSTGCMHYSFNVKMVKQDLEEQNEYDEGAYLPDRLAHELGGS